MPLTLSGNTGIAGVDGSASVPSVQGSDTNTGVFYPAADTVGVSTGGSERMRVDSSGNVGIGTSSPSTYGKFVVAGGDGNTLFNVGSSGVLRVAGYNSTYSGALLESVNTAQSAYLPITINGSYATVATGGTERMRIDSSGNVGIGTTNPQVPLGVTRNSGTYSPDTLFDVAWFGNGTSAGGAGVHIVSATNGKSELGFSNSTTRNAGLIGYNMSSNYMYFNTNSSERMRIDSSGNLLVGTTTAGSQKLRVQAATDVVLGVASATSVAGALTLNATNDANSANIPLDFRASAIYASAGIGTTASAANAFFNNAANNQFLRSTSALKYKTNIRDLESIDINKFRPVRYNSLCEADDPHKEHFGIIADEVANSGITELVTYGENGDVEGFQYERLTVVLVKAIQELKAELDALKGTK